MFELKKDPSGYEIKSLRLPVELIEKVQELATDYNLSFNKVVIQSVEYALQNMKTE